MRASFTPLVLVVNALLLLSPTERNLHAQGSLEPSGDPAPTQRSLEEIWDRIGTLEGTIDGLTSDVEDLESNIDDLETENGALQEQIQRITTQHEQDRFLLGLMFQDQLPWAFTLVDGVNAVGEEVSIAFGPDGVPWIAYTGSETLRIARLDGGEWQRSAIDESSGFTNVHPSLAFGPDGQPAVAYHNETIGILQYAEFDGQTWTTTVVDENPDTGEYPSLQFAPDGSPAIAYEYRTDNHLRFAIRTGNSWNVQPVDTDGPTGLRPSLAFSPDDLATIAFVDQGGDEFDLMLAGNFAGSWNILTIEASALTGKYSALGYGLDDVPMIIYRNAGTEEVAAAIFDTQNGFWAKETIDADGDSGEWMSKLVFAPDGSPLIAYYVNDTRSLRIARRDASGWIVTTVAEFGEVGRPNDMALGPDGQPMIAFVEDTNTNNNLWVARRYVPSP